MRHPGAYTAHRGVTRMNGAMMEDRWLSVDEIAAYLGIKRDTVYKWISEKGMPAHRMGRLWKLRREEVDEWVRSGGADETSDESHERKAVRNT